MIEISKRCAGERTLLSDSDLSLDCITRKNAFNLIKKWLKQEVAIVYNIDDDKMELLAKITYLEAENEYLKNLTKNREYFIDNKSGEVSLETNLFKYLFMSGK